MAVPWGELYAAIGRIAVGINHDNWMIFEAFRIVLKMDRAEASSFFYSLKSDAAQRDFALAVMADRLNSTDAERDLLRRLKVEVNELGRLSGIRNGFIHTPWSTDGDVFLVTDGAIPHPKLDMNDPLGQAAMLIKEIWGISARITEICEELEELPSIKSLP